MSRNSAVLVRGNSARASTRRTGGEFRATAWLLRHPLFAFVPALVVLAVRQWGAPAVSYGFAGLAAVLVIWWRAHPASFDRWAAPRLRSARRRWTVYRGRRWQRVLDDCELTRENRRTGQTLCPRVLRVRSVTPSIDTLTVRMVRGQDLQAWTDHTPALADALRAERVAVSRRRPSVLTVIVERRNPFPHAIDATPIPESAADVNLCRLDVGDNEYGGPFLLNLRGKRLLVVGASGAGKSSLLWNPLRAAGPMIREGLLRVWMIDLKGGTETDRGQALFHRWATTLDDAIDLLTDFRDSMVERQAWMRAEKVRRCEIGVDTPYELLMIDELAMLTAYGDRSAVREALRLLAEVLTQGRASDHGVAGYVQEPTKDVVDVRELFDTRICLGVTAASHVDMALGDGARDRGALADEIPGDPDHAGIGFVIDTGSRLPVRFRAGWVTDTDIDDLTTRCAPNQASRDDNGPDEGDVLPFPGTTHSANGTSTSKEGVS
ncbi:FtsK/SpoIIIE domain-containing protein [Pseudonocardia charpentierae]|uniref:FtsK/SpoIIIE domain-containing protein n=1 Tax=Pseudonocardia charpentierae TaxID=3075545 RepID=A0ABU2NGJ1_9PSEU|nr:FtsK/SpoIIIE domain-containing protein [Pseudonocardia sp. DSM 45834]MDT0351714.1 FtsK/SpoIIIE domain-containing protein [Pseudonocardia sp. DSM 45834]